MKNNWIVSIIVLVLLIVAIVLIVQNRRSTLKVEIGTFAINDTASVSKIFMADMQDNEVLLKKEHPGKWSLNDTLNARKEGIELLLSTMSKLAVKAPVSKASYDVVIKRLATSSVKVEIYQILPRVNIFNLIRLFPHEKLSKVYYVGNATPDNMGSFMLMDGSDTPFVVYLPGFKGYVSARYSAFTSDWRDHTIFSQKPAQISSIQIEFPQTPAESFKLDKYGDHEVKISQLGTGKVFVGFDTTRVIDFINAFRNIRFEESFQQVDAKYKDSIVSQTPLHIIGLKDMTGNIRKVKTYRRANIAQQEDLDGNILPYDVNRLYAVIEENKELLIVQYFVFDPITRPLSFLLGKPID
ncbi:MAG: DUF4340 domain-containing protein [Bacteroidales bacterium]|nr:DUF4340 domain-containing protein [Bacteroidales bacterium]